MSQKTRYPEQLSRAVNLHFGILARLASLFVVPRPILTSATSTSGYRSRLPDRDWDRALHHSSMALRKQARDSPRLIRPRFPEGDREHRFASRYSSACIFDLLATVAAAAVAAAAVAFSFRGRPISRRWKKTARRNANVLLSCVPQSSPKRPALILSAAVARSPDYSALFATFTN